MKAIRVSEFGSPEVLEIKEIPDIDRPIKEGKVLVRVHAAGINPADTYIRSGAYARLPELPWTPGMDGAGVVEEVGEGVTNVKAGDRVYIAGSESGTYAEQCLCGAGQVHLIPENISFEQGAAVFVNYATAFNALFQRGGAKAGETVFIHGASGGVGVAAIQLAKRAGLRVIGSAGSKRGLELVINEGAEHALDHTSENYMNELTEITNGNGPDIILEMLANVNLQKDLEAIAKYGRIMIIGNRGTIEINPRLTMGKNSDIRGMLLFNSTPDELSEIHKEIVAGLFDGSLKPVVGKTFPLAEAAAAHEAVMAPGAYGKIVLLP